MKPLGTLISAATRLVSLSTLALLAFGCAEIAREQARMNALRAQQRSESDRAVAQADKSHRELMQAIEEDTRRRKAEAKEAEERRLVYIQTKTNRPPVVIQCITERKFCAGMTEEEVEISLGKPWKKNKSGGIGGSFDQWVYGESTYIYLRNGVVVSWQVSE